MKRNASYSLTNNASDGLIKLHNFVFVIASYNNEEHVFKNLSSVATQRYPRWRIIYVNDASTDNTEMVYDRVVERLKIEKRCTYLKNDVNMKQAYSKYRAYQLVKDNEIVCILDGDDWLANTNALLYLNKVYNQGYKVCTSRYHVYENKNLKYTSNNTYDKYTIENKDYRYHPNYAFGHLKTGMGILFKSIPKERLMLGDEWLKCCTDCAEMYCITDLCSDPHDIYLSNEVLYAYNKDNSLRYENSHYNLHKSKEQQKYRASVLQKLKFDESMMYQLPKSFIIHLNFKENMNLRLNMTKQMKFIKNHEYEFFDATHYSNPRVQDIYEDYVLNYFDNAFVKYAPKGVSIEYEKLFVMDREHCTQKALGLIYSTFKLYEKIELEHPELDHVAIFEDDVYSLRNYDKHLYICPKLLEGKDLIYLGCHNNRNVVYPEKPESKSNVHDTIYESIMNDMFLYYGTYAYIVSKKMRRYILDLGFTYILQKNVSIDLLFNYIRIIDNPKNLSFYKYYKQLFVPEVRKDGIQNPRNMSFYSQRNINLKEYYCIQ